MLLSASVPHRVSLFTYYGTLIPNLVKQIPLIIRVVQGRAYPGLFKATFLAKLAADVRRAAASGKPNKTSPPATIAA
jgi:hypothetical protein